MYEPDCSGGSLNIVGHISQEDGGDLVVVTNILKNS